MPLRPDQDLTIRLDIPAGLVSPPTPEQKAVWSRLDWAPYTDTALTVLGVLLFFVSVWGAVGRDPPSRPVVVQYDPPEGFSPAALGYLDRRGYDGRQLTAAIMSLGRKGVLEVEETGRLWTVRRIGPIPQTLPPDERSVAEKLLPDEDALAITGISRRRVAEARRALRRELKRRFRGRYFVANRWWFLLGVVLSLVGFALVVARTRFGLPPLAWVPAAMLLVWGFPSGRLLTRGFQEWRIDLAEMSPKPSLLAASIFPLLALIPLAFLGVMAHALYRAVPPHLFLAALLLCAVNAVFFQLLERPTAAGQDVLNHVEGFKRFLTATEGHRIARLSSKEAHELYERFLPCAVALGLSVRWGAVFGNAVNSTR